jgi:hypothetical protein
MIDENDTGNVFTLACDDPDPIAVSLYGILLV